MTKVTTVAELIAALQQMDQTAVVLVSPWAVSDVVCVDYVNQDCWPVRGVLISN